MHMTRRGALRAAAGGAALAVSGCASDALPPLVGGGDRVTLQTRNGSLEGRVDADGVRAFRGVPFAAPPTGPLRFRPPEAVAPWGGVRPALAFAPMAMQPPDGEKSEDCLYVNVWTPAAPGPHPVYVWMHAGGNVQGRAGDPRYDGASFARQGVVVVTISHRVGVWGWLELGDVLGPEYAGSSDNGLRDIIAALAWVRDEIADFGGDPGRVTLGGLSSGAKNTCALLSAPAAAGLFQSAIVESGGGHTVQGLEMARAEGVRFMEAGRVRSGEALLGMSARRLLAAQNRFDEATEDPFPFRAVVGGGLLPARPIDGIAAGQGRGVRLLVGGTSDEGALFLDDRRGTSPIERGEIAHVSLAEAERIYAGYVSLYRDAPALERRLKFISAEAYWAPTMRVANARAALPDAETYVYRFDWRNRGGPFDGRAQHGAQIAYIWNTVEPAARASVPVGGAPLQIHEMWARFIKGEAPDPLGGLSWPRYRAEDRRILVIDAEFRLEVPDDRQLALWDGAI
jgi:para-nitrobenzyl esterase